MHVLVVAPMERERAALPRWSAATVCGVGSDAQGAVAAMLSGHRPDLVLLAGFAGGLDPSLPPGVTILCRESIDVDGHALAPSTEFNATIQAALHLRQQPFVRSRLLTIASPVTGSGAKRDLWNVHGAGGVDMETHGVARAASEAGVPWVALRVVLDPAQHSLPPSLAAWQSEEDERAIAVAALRRPLEWPGYARLGRDLYRARPALRRSVAISLRALQAGE